MPVALVVGGVSLVLLGVVMRVGGPVAPDLASPGDLMEIGRVEASRSWTLLIAGAGLVWIGARGAVGAPTSWMAARVAALTAALCALTLLQGLLVAAVVSAAGCVVLTIYGARRRASSETSR